MEMDSQHQHEIEVHKKRVENDRRISYAEQDEAVDKAAEDILWNKWEEEETVDPFGFLELARDGGFSEVPTLYANGRVGRWANASIMVIFVIYNLVSVSLMDTTFIFEPDEGAKELGTTLTEIQRFYLSRSIVNAVLPMLDFDTISLLGFLELLGLLVILVKCAYDIAQGVRKSGFTRWFKCQKIFWDTLPALSVYSGMRLLYCIIPSIFLQDVYDLVQLFEDARTEPNLFPVAVRESLKWLALTTASFIIGFDTFLMKLRIVTATAHKFDLTLWTFLPTLQFFVQVVGVVQLGPYTRRRLFNFIFGGEDGRMEEDESVNMNTWNALLAKRIYQHYNFVQFLVVMMSFSDLDFQSLVLNENREKKEEIHTGLVSATHSASLSGFKDVRARANSSLTKMKSKMKDKIMNRSRTWGNPMSEPLVDGASIKDVPFFSEEVRRDPCFSAKKVSEKMPKTKK